MCGAIWTVLILEFLRQGHRSMGIYLLWMVTCFFGPGEPLSIQRGDIQIPTQGNSSRHQVLPHPEDRPLRSKTYVANDTVELYCPWCKSMPLTATALSHGDPRNAFSTSVITTSWWWNKVIKATCFDTSSEHGSTNRFAVCQRPTKPMP